MLALFVAAGALTLFFACGPADNIESEYDAQIAQAKKNGGHAAVVTWNANTDPIDHYNVYHYIANSGTACGPLTLVTSLTGTKYIDAVSQPKHFGCWAITAVNTLGVESAQTGVIVKSW